MIGSKQQARSGPGCTASFSYVLSASFDTLTDAGLSLALLGLLPPSHPGMVF